MTLSKIESPRKLVSLPILSGLSPSSVMLKLPTGVGRPGLCAKVDLRGQDLGAGTEDNSVRLRIAAVAGVTRRIQHPVVGVQDRGAAVIAAIRVGCGEMELALRIDLGHDAIIQPGNRVRRIDHARR